MGGVRPFVRSERYTKMAGLYVMLSALVVLARKSSSAAAADGA